MIRKLTKGHIDTEWSDSDGYWIVLKPGWKSASDPVGVLHTIHEDTKSQAMAEGILPCFCVDCVAADYGK